MAAEEMGRVRAIPTRTETAIPIQKGWRAVVRLISEPKALAREPMGGAMR